MLVCNVIQKREAYLLVEIVCRSGNLILYTYIGAFKLRLTRYIFTGTDMGICYSLRNFLRASICMD
jgi:hypothetical protein